MDNFLFQELCVLLFNAILDYSKKQNKTFGFKIAFINCNQKMGVINATKTRFEKNKRLFFSHSKFLDSFFLEQYKAVLCKELLPPLFGFKVFFSFIKFWSIWFGKLFNLFLIQLFHIFSQFCTLFANLRKMLHILAHFGILSALPWTVNIFSKQN